MPPLTEKCYDMKKILLITLSAVVSLTAVAQSAWDEIKMNPKLAAGKYMAYEYPEDKVVAPPEGYKPFYVSMYARHGSRYLTDKENMITRSISSSLPTAQASLPTTASGHLP